MNFSQSIQSAFRNYATFTGRAARSEYWWFVLSICLAILVTVQLDAMFFPVLDESGERYQPITAIFSILIFLPGLALTVRRLHDTDRSGWWVLLQLIPVLGGIVLIIFTAQKGESGSNKYGPDPLSLVSKIVDAIQN